MFQMNLIDSCSRSVPSDECFVTSLGPHSRTVLEDINIRKKVSSDTMFINEMSTCFVLPAFIGHFTISTYFYLG